MMATNDALQYLVFWLRGGRIGSVPFTIENEQAMHRLMRLTLMQTDVTGTKHYNVEGLRKGGR